MKSAAESGGERPRFSRYDLCPPPAWQDPSGRRGRENREASIRWGVIEASVWHGHWPPVLWADDRWDADIWRKTDRSCLRLDPHSVYKEIAAKRETRGEECEAVPASESFWCTGFVVIRSELRSRDPEFREVPARLGTAQRQLPVP